MQNLYNARITEDDPLTLDEEYEIQRIRALPEALQPLAVEYHLNTYQALPPYTERFQQTKKQEEA